MKTDARTRYTKKVIREALIKKLKETAVNKITVKCICEEAEINRGSFYKYYEDIFDLYEKTKADFVEGFFREFSEGISADIENQIAKFLEKIKSDSDFVEAISKQSDAYDFMKQMCEEVYVEYKVLIEDFCRGKSEGEMKGIYMYISYGCTGLISEWIMTGMKEDERELAKLLSKLVLNTVSGKNHL